jgi:hypothetical protein
MNPSKFVVRCAKKWASTVTGVKQVKLFTTNTAKMDKSNKLGKELNIIMHLAPANLSGFNTCPMASPGCKAACLNTTGHGAYSTTQLARVRKTKLFFEHRNIFLILLHDELRMWQNKANKMGMTLAVRLNGTSDIQWETVAPWLFTEFPNVQFYDYTKIANRFAKELPKNYHLTFSRSESNESEVGEVLRNGGNVAVVFSDFDWALNGTYLNHEIVDGVNTDRRFSDKRGVIVGLKAIGKAKKDTTGFVVQN